MKKLEGAKKTYEAIEIPQELGVVVEDAIRQGLLNAQEREEKVIYLDNMHENGSGRQTDRRQRKRGVRGSAAVSRRIGKTWNGWKAAACLLGVITVGTTVLLNTSEAAAATLGSLPVIGGIARVLTIRDYSYEGENADITARVPGIVQESISGEEENGSADTDYISQVNAMIDQTVADYIAQAESDIAAYKEAFLATGGTEEEFREKDIQVDVDYDVTYSNGEVLSFVLNANESWNSAYGVQYFYNLNLEDGREITLQELLGEDYESLANEQILTQMQQRSAADSSIVFWGSDMDGFTGIDDETRFYINDKGNPVIVFEKYEVGPGSIGRPEFEIER